MYIRPTIVLSLFGSTTVQATIARKPIAPPALAASNATYGQSTFEQLLDHSNPSLGTFSQRYWWNSEWWDGEGSPVFHTYLLFQRWGLCSLTRNLEIGGLVHPW